MTWSALWGTLQLGVRNIGYRLIEWASDPVEAGNVRARIGSLQVEDGPVRPPHVRELVRGPQGQWDERASLVE